MALILLHAITIIKKSIVQINILINQKTSFNFVNLLVNYWSWYKG